METEVREYQKAIEYLCELVRVGGARKRPGTTV